MPPGKQGQTVVIQHLADLDCSPTHHGPAVAHAGHVEVQLGQPLRRLPVRPEVGAGEWQRAVEAPAVTDQHVSRYQYPPLLQVERDAPGGVAGGMEHPHATHLGEGIAFFQQLLA